MSVLPVSEIAMTWWDRGIVPIPCKMGSKVPVVRWGRWQRRVPPERLVRGWFKYERNLALVTGTGRLLVLDFDSMVRYVRWKRDHPRLATSYTVRTPRPGRHVYLQCNKVVSSMYLNHLDVKGARGLITAPPSIHPNGKQYEVCVNAPMIEVDSLSDAIAFGDSVKEICPSVVDAMDSFPFTESESPPVTRQLDLIGRVRAAMPLLTLLSHYTTPIPSDRTGRWYIMRCPHPQHVDRNPSFWADAVKGRCGCFTPRCRATYPNRSMDVFNLYGWLHGIEDNGDAIRGLAREVDYFEDVP